MGQLELIRLCRVFWGKLGGCSSCLRMAWRSACIASVAWLFCYPFLQVEIIYAFAIIPLSIVALWIFHILAFGIKSAQNSSQYITEMASRSAPGHLVARRKFLTLVSRAMWIGVLVSVAPDSASAQSIVTSGCGQNGCGSCSRPAYQNGNFLGCVSCRSCGSSCWQSPGSAFPNGC
jgi:hypothetical protein